MGEALRERHRMIPYLYTMNYRAYKQDLPLILPMYYDYPESEEAYQVRNQFMFGTELLVAAITTPRIEGLNVAEINVWLPEGNWYDIYTGMIYEGDRMLKMYRDINSIPVLAKAGAILPFTDEISSVEAVRNPSSLHLKVYAGSNGRFELYEDDNDTCAYETDDCVKTAFTYTETDQVEFKIAAAKGNLSLIPEKRSYIVELTGFVKDYKDFISVTNEEEEVEVALFYNDKTQAIIVQIPETSVSSDITITIKKAPLLIKNNVLEKCFDFLNQAEIKFVLKDEIFGVLKKETRLPVVLAQLQSMNLDEKLFCVLTEILTAKI